MAHFEIPVKAKVSARNKEIFDRLEKSLGHVPNLYAVMAYSRNGLFKYLAFQNAPSSLNIKEKEVINLVVSEVNGSKYCLNTHTHIAKMNDFSKDEILKIRKGNASDDKLNALAVFTKAIAKNKGNVSEKVLKAFFGAGYSKENMVDVILQICDKAVSNYLYNLTGVPVDFPFTAEWNEEKEK